MDNYVSANNKIPYDHTPIFRSEKNKNSSAKDGLKTKILAIVSIAMIICNIILCVTCHIYLKNGKIKVVNIYNDSFTTEQVLYLKESMRSAKYSAVCVSVGLQSNIITSNLTNDQFYNSTKSHGAGFLYKIDENNNSAYFITCYHVLNYSSSDPVTKDLKVWVLPASMLVPLKVEVVGFSAKDDVAVLKYTHENILESLEGMVPVDVYDSTFLQEFDDVFTIGNPLNYGLSGSSGEITSYRHMLKYEGNNHAWIKTDTPINPGNSGGGFFNADGKLIGMVNANIPKTSAGDPVSNMAYAIPGTLVVSIAENIINNNLSPSDKIKKVTFGMTLVRDENMGVEHFKDKYKDKNGEFKYLEQEYIIVSSFDSSSVAKGKLQVNDRLLSMKIYVYGEDDPIEVPIINTFTIYEYAYAIKPGSEVEFKVQRQNSSNVTEEHIVSVRATILS